MIRIVVTALAALTIGALGCKSKLEKCQGVCTKITDEDLASCGSDKACKEMAREKLASCNDLCDTAVGTGASKRERDRESDEEKPQDEATKDQANCDKGTDVKGCINTAGRAIKESPKNYPKAAKYLEKACDLGDMFGCESFAKMMRDGKGMEKDEKRARALLEKACAGNAGGACTSVGLAEGAKTQKGRDLIAKGCDLGDATGCLGIGGIYLNGIGVPRDPAKARAYLDKGCKAGESKACEKLAEIR